MVWQYNSASKQDRTLLTYFNFLEGVGDHSNEHVEQDDHNDEREDPVQDPAYKLCHHKVWHVHVVLVGHAKHGPEQEAEGLIKSAGYWDQEHYYDDIIL